MTGHVYFAVFDTRPNEVKIGWTSDLWQRNRKLKYEVRCEPSFLGIQAGSKELETDLHRAFQCHQSSGTDWFYFHEDIKQYINANAVPYVHPRRPKKVKERKEQNRKPKAEWSMVHVDAKTHKALKLLKAAWGLESMNDVVKRLLFEAQPDLLERLYSLRPDWRETYPYEVTATPVPANKGEAA